MENFFDIYYQKGDSPVFSYRSGLAVWEETFENGVLLSSGNNAAGYPLNVLSNFPSRLNPLHFHEPSAFNVDIDGVCIDRALKFIDFQSLKTENCIHPLSFRRSTSPFYKKQQNIENASFNNIKKY